MSSHKFFLSTFAERRTSLLIGVGFVHVGKNGRGNVLAINFSLVSILFCYNFKKMGQNDWKPIRMRPHFMFLQFCEKRLLQSHLLVRTTNMNIWYMQLKSHSLIYEIYNHFAVTLIWKTILLFGSLFLQTWKIAKKRIIETHFLRFLAVSMLRVVSCTFVNRSRVAGKKNNI